MKRKRLDRADWQEIAVRRYLQQRFDTPAFAGLVSLLCIDRVHQPVSFHFKGEDVTVCDDGMQWLEILPEAGGWLITAMYDAAGGIVQWYIDIIDGWQMTPEGTVYFDDLYLDLIVQPNGDITLADADELQAALAAGHITPAQYRAAHAAASALCAGMLADINAFAARCAAGRARMLAAIK